VEEVNKSFDELYSKLMASSKKVFDSYVETRSLEKTIRDLKVDRRNTFKQFKNKNFQATLNAYNKELASKVVYDKAVIIDELWKKYGSEGISVKDATSILVLLGKEIGMWNTDYKHQAKTGNVTYNIVNYSSIKDEIEKNKEAVEKEKERQEQEEFDIPDGIQITDYSDTVN
jgi:phosphoenolpyruvate carboxylase